MSRTAIDEVLIFEQLRKGHCVHIDIETPLVWWLASHSRWLIILNSQLAVAICLYYQVASIGDNSSPVAKVYVWPRGKCQVVYCTKWQVPSWILYQVASAKLYILYQVASCQVVYTSFDTKWQAAKLYLVVSIPSGNQPSCSVLLTSGNQPSCCVSLA